MARIPELFLQEETKVNEEFPAMTAEPPMDPPSPLLRCASTKGHKLRLQRRMRWNR